MAYNCCLKICTHDRCRVLHKPPVMCGSRSRRTWYACKFWGNWRILQIWVSLRINSLSKVFHTFHFIIKVFQFFLSFLEFSFTAGLISCLNFFNPTFQLNDFVLLPFLFGVKFRYFFLKIGFAHLSIKLFAHCECHRATSMVSLLSYLSLTSSTTSDMPQSSSWFRHGPWVARVHALADSASPGEWSRQSTVKRALRAQGRCRSLLPGAPLAFGRAFLWVSPHQFSKLADDSRIRLCACLGFNHPELIAFLC